MDPSPRFSLDRLGSRELFEREPPAALFHYTDFDGVAGILQSRSLWLSKISTLNDTSEVQLAAHKFKERAGKAAERLPEDEAQFLRGVAGHLDEARRTNICVASFGEEDDQLEHWRSYANDGRGIALGFSGAELRNAGGAHDVRLLRCVYDAQSHARIIEELLHLLMQSLRSVRPRGDAERQALADEFTTLFLLTAPVLKDAHFGGEREWRLVSLPRPPDDPRLTAVLTGNLASVRFVMPLCPEPSERSRIIRSVTIGPTLDPDNVADAVDVLARHNGFEISAIRFSQVPYRGRR